VRRPLAGAVVGLAVLTAFLTAGSSPATAAPACVTLTYLAHLDHADAALAAVPVQTATALAELDQAEQLAPSAGPELSPIIAGLTATPPDVAGSPQRLDILVSTLALPASSPCGVDGQAARNLLHQVYASPVFADLDQNQQPSLLDRIGAAINWLLSHLFGALGTGGSIALGLLVLVAIIAFIAYRVRGVIGARRVALAGEPSTAGDDPDAEWRLAVSAARRGDHREAIRRAFRSALLDVAGHRAQLNRAWTTREMLATIAADPDLLVVLAPAAASFDTAWYGVEPVRAEDWDVARARCEAVRRVARHGAGRTPQ